MPLSYQNEEPRAIEPKLGFGNKDWVSMVMRKVLVQILLGRQERHPSLAMMSSLCGIQLDSYFAEGSWSEELPADAS